MIRAMANHCRRELTVSDRKPVSNRRAAYPTEQANKNGARNKFKHLGPSRLTLNRTTHQRWRIIFSAVKLSVFVKNVKLTPSGRRIITPTHPQVITPAPAVRTILKFYPPHIGRRNKTSRLIRQLRMILPCGSIIIPAPPLT